MIISAKKLMTRCANSLGIRRRLETSSMVPESQSCRSCSATRYNLSTAVQQVKTLAPVFVTTRDHRQPTFATFLDKEQLQQKAPHEAEKQAYDCGNILPAGVMAGGRHSEYTLPRKGECDNPCRVEQGPKHSEHRNIIAAHVPVEPEGPQSWHAAAWDCASIRFCATTQWGRIPRKPSHPAARRSLIPCFCLPQCSFCRDGLYGSVIVFVDTQRVTDHTVETRKHLHMI